MSPTRQPGECTLTLLLVLQTQAAKLQAELTQAQEAKSVLQRSMLNQLASARAGTEDERVRLWDHVLTGTPRLTWCWCAVQTRRHLGEEQIRSLMAENERLRVL